MNICSTIEKRSVKALALGGFDGIHLGHRALIGALGDRGAVLAIEHSRVCLTPGRSRERFSPAPVCFVGLEEILEMSAEEFIAALKGEFPALEKLVVGYDFRFGRGRAASAEDLRRIYDGETIVIAEVRLGGEPVHAAKIRTLLLNGDAEAAAKMLARDHFVEGAIVRGQGLGAKRLYPTINIETERFLLPMDGVYASRAEIDGRLYRSVSFVGKRVSADGSFAVETHILDGDFSRAANGEAAIFFASRIRGNRKFDNLEELKSRIALDIAEAEIRLG